MAREGAHHPRHEKILSTKRRRAAVLVSISVGVWWCGTERVRSRFVTHTVDGASLTAKLPFDAARAAFSIDARELRGALRGAGCDVSAREAQGLLARVDADASGAISLDGRELRGRLRRLLVVVVTHTHTHRGGYSRR